MYFYFNTLKKYIFDSQLSLILFAGKIIIFAIFEIVGLGLLVSLLNSELLGNPMKLNLIGILSDFLGVQKNLFTSSGVVFLFYILKMSYSFFFIKKQHSLIAKSHKNYSTAIFSNYLRSVYYRSSKISSNDIIRNITSLSEKVFNEYFIGIFNLLTEFVVFFLILAAFFMYSPLITFFLILFFSIIGGFFFNFYEKNSSKLGITTVVSYKYLTDIVSTVIGLSKELRALKLIKNFSSIFFDNISKFVNAKKMDSFYSRIPLIFIEFYSILMLLLLLVVADIFFDSNKTKITELLSFFSLGVLRLIPSVNRILSNFNSIKFHTPLIIELDFDNYYLLKSEKINPSKHDTKKFKKNILINNLSILIDGIKILDNFSMNINKGDKILIYGDSGSGKSSFFNFITGLVPLSFGKVSVDGNKVDKYMNLNNSIGIVTQENFIIPDRTIYYNVTLNEKKNKKNLLRFKKILKIVNLKSFVDSLDDREDAYLSASGISNFSGGERQKLCIARALFNNFDLLLMDEPFSSLDLKNTNQILKNLFNNFKNQTIIIISHVPLNYRYFNNRIFIK